VAGVAVAAGGFALVVVVDVAGWLDPPQPAATTASIDTTETRPNRGMVAVFPFRPESLLNGYEEAGWDAPFSSPPS
jgi:hypothetical protein